MDEGQPSINGRKPTLPAVIVVATDDFEVYHDVVAELRERNARFTTVTPGSGLPEDARVAIVGAGEDAPDAELETVHAHPGASRHAVDEAIALLRGGDGRIVVGIDPGDRPGIAVLSGETVVAAFQVPVDEAVEIIDRETADAPDPLVRIGDGARLQGSKLIDRIDDIPVELVDETGTTPHLGTGARGMGDVLAATNIARRTGERIESRPFEPTAGEIQVIKNRSRRRSDDGRTLPGALARRVALGELTMDEALARHRSHSE